MARERSYSVSGSGTHQGATQHLYTWRLGCETRSATFALETRHGDESVERTILVPLAGMQLAETALPVARLLAELLHIQLQLVRVVPETAPGPADGAARTYLTALASSEALQDLQPAARLMRGDP